MSSIAQKSRRPSHYFDDDSDYGRSGLLESGPAALMMSGLEKLLLIYKGACSEFLHQKQKKFENVRQNRLLSEIQSYEEEMIRRPWVNAVGDEYIESLQRELIKLQQLQIFARYGDYTQRVTHQLRDSSR